MPGHWPNGALDLRSGMWPNGFSPQKDGVDRRRVASGPENQGTRNTR